MNGSQMVVLADIVRSRTFMPAQRRAVQQYVRELAGEQVGFRFSGGDEFEWILSDAPESWDRLLYFRTLLAVGSGDAPGVQIRCGVGRGDVTVTSGDGPYAQDGPAFHRAREAYESLRQSGGRAHSSHLAPFQPWGRPETWTALRDGRPDAQRDALILLMDAIMRGWTAAQWAAVACRLEGLRYEDAGARLGVSAQAVQQRLKAARFDLYLVGHSALKAGWAQGGAA